MGKKSRLKKERENDIDLRNLLRDSKGQFFPDDDEVSEWAVLTTKTCVIKEFATEERVALLIAVALEGTPFVRADLFALPADLYSTEEMVHISESYRLSGADLSDAVLEKLKEASLEQFLGHSLRLLETPFSTAFVHHTLRKHLSENIKSEFLFAEVAR